MYANLSMQLEINNKKQPKNNEYINNEYDLIEEARQIFKSKLISVGIEFARSANSEAFEEFYRYISINIPKTPEPSYTSQTENDAKNLITEYFIDEIIDQLIESGEASSDMYNDYDNVDSIFNETITDRDYSRDEAIEILDKLYEHEEEDSGLWEGQDWESVLRIKAAYTYDNAVYSEWNDIITNINENIDVEQEKYEIALQLLEIFNKTNLITNINDIDEVIGYMDNEDESSMYDSYYTRLKDALRERVLEEL